VQPQLVLQTCPFPLASALVTSGLLQHLLLQIKESLVRFGVSPECRHLLVARFNSDPADVRAASAITVLCASANRAWLSARTDTLW
jgi:hypothetical protein